MLRHMPRSALNEIVWPALPDSLTATIIAVLAQLERSQWWPPDLLREVQLAQLGHLVDHASRTVPFHRERLAAAGYRGGEPLTPELWARLPVLTRAEVQEAGPALRSAEVPLAHGEVREINTSGSTGLPVTVAKTALASLFACAFTIRARLWHRLDPAKTFCEIRGLDDMVDAAGPDALAYPHGLQLEQWHDALARVFPTGPAVLLRINTDIVRQAEWLRRQDPHYLRTFPTNALALARHCLKHGIRLPRLERVLTGAEVLTAETRAACREAWGAEVVDHYGTREVDWIALQCPEREDVLHVQSEAALVEVLGADGQPCGPGEVGRVVVTPLHNFATPLLRYELGDHAEVGPPCGCGRGLPVLARVLGRTRNMLRLPSGGSVWPLFATGLIREVVPAVRQFQLVQRSLEGLELRLVVDRPLGVDEEEALRNWLVRRLGHPFALAISYHGEIPRSAGGKYEDFRSVLAD